jgi:hypothetical protein
MWEVKGGSMHAQDLVFNQTVRHIKALGYADHEAEDTANIVLSRYKENRFERATDFIDYATKHAKHAKQHYGPPPAKSRKKS